MSRFGIITLAAALVGLFSVPAQAGTILFTKVVSVNRSVNIFDTNQFDLDLGFGNKVFGATNNVKLFDNLVVSPADVGATFTATADTDPGFSQVAPRLSDGLNEFVKVTLTEHQVGGTAEQRGWQESFFFGHVTPQTPPDLSGSEVVQINLHIDKFVISSAPPSGGGAALAALDTPPPQFDLVFTLQMLAVPEPAAPCLLLAGVLGLGLKRNRFRRS